jgi:hypothetical protein
MRLRNSVLLSVTLVGTLALAGACAKKDDVAPGGPAAASSGAATTDAKTELGDAFRKLNTTTAAFTLDTDIGSMASVKGSGVSDPVNRASKSSIKVTGRGANVNTEVLVTGTDLYVKLNLPLLGIDPAKWTHIDIAKAGSLSALGLGDPADPANVKTFSDAVTTVEKSGSGTYKGTIDVTKRAAAGVGADAVKALGDGAKSVPFEVVVNGDGYPTKLTISMPAGGELPATTVTTTFSEFGKPVTIEKPAPAQVQEAPEGLLSRLGG